MKMTLKQGIALSIIPQLLVVNLLKTRPDWVESLYSNGLYLWLSKISRIILGWIPFSLGDLLYVAAILLVIRFFILKGHLFFNATRKFFTEVFAMFSIAYLIFHLAWGMNYHRKQLHEFFDIDDEYTTQELIAFTERIIDRSNAIHLELVANESVKVEMPFTKWEVLNGTQNGYKNLARAYPLLTYDHSSIKMSTLSLPLTFMGYSGYLNPFTNEAQVNYKMPIYKFPTTVAHEQAHQLGFAAENEANFIGYLATINNDDPYYKYSGYTFALRYCLGEMYRRDLEEYQRLSERINEGIKKNYREVTAFWRSYENPAEPIFKKSFDTYLKANSQEKGIESYSYIVALLVNYYEDHNL
ncbi:DUF3810 domain-containing protein [Sungkyunkwania multivorans]|uniref:DUF3810 domain-containing protein n=1 Tax=Sungkyunkwania multivorans TaxID=1173618 RepID=A0ABW3CVX8_9FLAO